LNAPRKNDGMDAWAVLPRGHGLACAAVLLSALAACGAPPATQPLGIEGVRLADLASAAEPAGDGGRAASASIPGGGGTLAGPGLRPGTVFPLPGISKLPTPTAIPGRPVDAEADNPAPRWTPRQLFVQMLVFRRPAPRLDVALRMAGAAPIDARTREIWHANGLRVGVLARDRLKLFMANAPRPLGRVSRQVTSQAYEPFVLVDHVRGVHRVRVMHEAERPRIERLVGGRFQFLMKLGRPLERPDRRLHLDLLPHHYGARPSLLPRLPQQKVMDGTTFDSLRLYEPLPDPEQVLVIWAQLPPLPGSPGGAAAAGSGGSATTPTSNVPSLDPRSLGEAMLSGRRQKTPVQMVLLLAAGPQP